MGRRMPAEGGRPPAWTAAGPDGMPASPGRRRPG